MEKTIKKRGIFLMEETIWKKKCMKLGSMEEEDRVQ